MALSKKTYIAVADAIRAAYEAQEYTFPVASKAVALVAQNLAKVFYADNQNFDKAKFYEAAIPKRWS